MNKIVIFYSYSGKTKTVAQKIATEEGAEVVEIKTTKPVGKFKAYIGGIISVMRGKSWPIQSLGVDLSSYDKYILLAPIWADNPAPPFNALIEQLPGGKTIVAKMVSASGKSNCKERLEAAIKAKGSILESFEDIKA